MRLDPRTKMVMLFAVSVVLLLGGNGGAMFVVRTAMLLFPFGLLAISERMRAAGLMLAAYLGAYALAVLEDFGGWARAQLPLASSKLALHRALQYAVEFWPYVMNVLEDGHLELSNNVAEQAQRIFVVGRKNWLFSDALRGARGLRRYTASPPRPRPTGSIPGFTSSGC